MTGLVASDLLLVQVLLMARIPLVERSYGQDELARRHRWVGFASFNLMVLHVVAITLGYAATSPAGLWGTIVDFVLNYPGMLLAVAGTVALCAVVVTSMRAARRRLRYESWHLIHLYAYLGVGLALPHQLWTGQEFLTSPVATVYWWGLYAAALGQHPGLAGRPAGLPQPAARPRGHGRPGRERRRDHGDRRRPAPAPAAGAGGAVPALALPRRAGGLPGAPVLPVRGPGRAQPADHRRPPR